MSDMRYVKVYSDNDGWVRKEFEELKEKDVFILFNPDGQIVESPDDGFIYIALSDAYFSEEHNSLVVLMARYEDKK